jgi:inner membrane transporter RhtA
MSHAVSSRPINPALNRFLPYIAVVGAMLSFSIGASFAKTLFPVIGAQATTAYRVGLAAIMLLVLWRPWRFHYDRPTLISLLYYGLSVAFMNLLFFMAMARIPVGIALAIEFMGPLTLALFRARKPVHFVWVGLAVLGVGLLIPLGTQVHALDPVGVALAASAGVFWALYIVFGKRLTHVHSGASVAIGMSIAALIIVPIGVISAGAAMFSLPLLLPAIGLAIMASAVPYTLEMFALRQIPERTFGVIISGDPAIAAVAGIFILHEHLSEQQWLAILAIVIAAAGMILTSGEDETTPAVQPAE